MGDLCVQERSVWHIASGLECLTGRAHDEPDKKRGIVKGWDEWWDEGGLPLT